MTTAVALITFALGGYLGRWSMRKIVARVAWLEGLFDFSDPEIVLHSGPNDPVTKDAVVVLRSHYETRRPAPTNT